MIGTPESFIEIAEFAVLFAFGYFGGRFDARYKMRHEKADVAVRERNTYSKSGAYLIEHAHPGSDLPYTVWDVSDKNDSGFTCATRSEAEDLCHVLETGDVPDRALGGLTK